MYVVSHAIAPSVTYALVNTDSGNIEKLVLRRFEVSIDGSDIQDFVIGRGTFGASGGDDVQQQWLSYRSEGMGVNYRVKNFTSSSGTNGLIGQYNLKPGHPLVIDLPESIELSTYSLFYYSHGSGFVNLGVEIF